MEKAVRELQPAALDLPMLPPYSAETSDSRHVHESYVVAAQEADDTSDSRHVHESYVVPAQEASAYVAKVNALLVRLQEAKAKEAAVISIYTERL
eukprot:gene20806-27641_t